MVQWTVPEYLDANPAAYPGDVVKMFKPDAPAESNDKLSDWYSKGYNAFYEEIQEYQDALANGETPDATLKLALMSYGTANLSDEKDAPSDEVVPPSGDDEDPIAQNSGSGLGQGIRTYTVIGGDVVSADIISITATMSSGYDEGNEQASCTVNLNNNYQKYGKKIASYQWAPRITRIWSQAAIDYNMDNGVQTSEYMIFQGFMSDAKYNNETATVTFGCISIEAAGSYKDTTWSPEDGYILKMQETVDQINDGGNNLGIEIKNLKLNNPNLVKQDYTPSDLSGNDALRNIAKDNKESFYYGHDFDDNVYVVLTDSDSFTETVFLDPYVIEPADTSTIFGHANVITTIAGTTSIEDTMRHIPSPVKDELFATKYNWESIYRYGKTEDSIIHDPNLKSVQADVEADIEDENFKQYIDRDIKLVVANRIPKILSMVIFRVPDLQTGELLWIYGGVKKKEVEYSTSGIITHLEVARIDNDYGNELTSTYEDLTLNTDEYTASDGQRWQSVFRNGKWIYGYSGSFLDPFNYSDNPPSEVSDHFKDQISNIEASNDAKSPNWRSGY